MCSLLHLVTNVAQGREPAEAGSLAIQHYLVRLKAELFPLLHGLFLAEGQEKMLSYTTPGSG